MKVITPGKLPVPRPTLWDVEYTCPRCGSVLQLEQGDKVVTERSIDGRTYFDCAFCGNHMAVVWNGKAHTFEVVA